MTFKKPLAVVLGFLLVPSISLAAVNSLNGLTVEDQFLTTPNENQTNSMHMKIVTRDDNTHRFRWDGTPWRVDQGGTGTTSAFVENGVFYFDGLSFVQSMLPGNMFRWDEALSRLTIGSEAGDTGFEKVNLFIGGDTTTNSALGMIIRNHSTSNFGSAIRLEGAHGTAENPEAVTEGMTVGAFVFGGYNGEEFPATARAQIRAIAEEDWSPTQTGISLAFTTTEPGSNNRTEKMRITGEGNVGIGTADPEATLDVVAPDDTAVLKLDGAASCIVLADSDGDGYTYVSANDGVLSASVTPCD